MLELAITKVPVPDFTRPSVPMIGVLMTAVPPLTVMVGSPVLPTSSDRLPPVPEFNIQLLENPLLPKMMPPIERAPSRVTVASVAGVTVPKLAMPSAPLASMPPCQLAVLVHDPPPLVVHVPLDPVVEKITFSPYEVPVALTAYERT